MAREHEIERMLVRLVGDATSYQRMLRNSQQAAQRTATAVQTAGKRMESVQRSLQKAGQAMVSAGRRMTLFVTAPIVAAGVGLVKMASDAAEIESKFGVVYSSIGQRANAAAAELDRAYGLSSVSSRKLLSDTGDLLTGFGFSQKAALDMSQEVQKLAVDLASFTNISGGAARASAALTKGLLGERESMKELGIVVLEADVKAKAALNTMQGMIFETERQAKAFATLQIAQEQSKNAIGDYARTAGSFANQFRELKADIEDVAAKLGRELLPAAQSMVAVFRDATKWVTGLSERNRRLIVTIAGIAAAAGPTLWLFGALAGSVSKVIALTATMATGVRLATATLWNLKTALIATQAACVALALTGIYLIAREIYKTMPAIQEFTAAMDKLSRQGREQIRLQVQGQQNTLARILGMEPGKAGAALKKEMDRIDNEMRGVKARIAKHQEEITNLAPWKGRTAKFAEIYLGPVAGLVESQWNKKLREGIEQQIQASRAQLDAYQTFHDQMQGLMTRLGAPQAGAGAGAGSAQNALRALGKAGVDSMTDVGRAGLRTAELMTKAFSGVFGGVAFKLPKIPDPPPINLIFDVGMRQAAAAKSAEARSRIAEFQAAIAAPAAAPRPVAARSPSGAVARMVGGKAEEYLKEIAEWTRDQKDRPVIEIEPADLEG